MFAWVTFAALIITVGLQVLARDLLHAPMIWTGDVAQLLFTWLIFLGAAAGLRVGAHYTVDLLPMHRRFVKVATDWTGFLSGVLVAALLLRFGWELAAIRSTAVIQSLGISRFWMFLSIPVSGP
ncbi:TRAP transporter small permease subunit [Breoghania sp.]|uniref:TRAP transporter small permease n=1 Tax=Breoghania sp. TaxID=2065378 RepID=UPI00260C687F|nr:TRAP transporter small permease subunit [Breoghania sp.]MDJ0933019.1 TRAP transporter small permease subunit [Breoghania sp.]